MKRWLYGVQTARFGSADCKVSQVLWMFASFTVLELGIIKFGKRIGPTANFETFGAALATGFQIIFGVSLICFKFSSRNSLNLHTWM